MPETAMWNSAKRRAKDRGVPFTIRPEDIVIPPCCPVLGMPLKRKDPSHRGPAEHSPSLDRIRPELGYVPGNIVVISHRANRIKNDATLEELQRVAAWLETTLAKVK